MPGVSCLWYEIECKGTAFFWNEQNAHTPNLRIYNELDNNIWKHKQLRIRGTYNSLILKQITKNVPQLMFVDNFHNLFIINKESDV